MRISVLIVPAMAYVSVDFEMHLFIKGPKFSFLAKKSSFCPKMVRNFWPEIEITKI